MALPTFQHLPLSIIQRSQWDKLLLKISSKSAHFLSRIFQKMLSKRCQNVVKTLSFSKSSKNVVKMLSKRCQNVVIFVRNVVKMLSFFMDPKRLHLCSIKAPFMLHFASPVPLGTPLGIN